LILDGKEGNSLPREGVKPKEVVGLGQAKTLRGKKKEKKLVRGEFEDPYLQRKGEQRVSKRRVST